MLLISMSLAPAPVHTSYTNHPATMQAILTITKPLPFVTIRPLPSPVFLLNGLQCYQYPSVSIGYKPVFICIRFQSNQSCTPVMQRLPWYTHDQAVDRSVCMWVCLCVAGYVFGMSCILY